MPDKDPSSYEVITYLWVILLSLWGGSASYIRRVRSMQIPRYSFVEFIGEVVIAAGVGVLTFFLCEWGNLDKMLSAVFIAITAHMGSRALLIAEQVLERYIKRKFNIRDAMRQTPSPTDRRAVNKNSE